ncbi:MAG: hypothetical protein ACOYOU_10150 [Kiritimatiellia bacterium]
MKQILAVVIWGAGCAGAQMSAEFTLNQSVYLVGEAIRADVCIVNHATTPFMVGSGINRQNGLFFQITDRRHDTLTLSQPGASMISNLLLPGGETHRAAFELDEWYPLGKTGSYIATAMVRRDDRRYESVSRAFDIVPGLEIKTAIQLFADLPDSQRKLSLVYFVRRQAEYIFLRITDTPGDRVWSTLELGRLLRTTPPTIEVASDGLVIIVHRATQDVYLRTQVKSTVRGVELLGQEQILDRRAAEHAPVEQMPMADESQKPAPSSKSSWWWPFGGSGDKSDKSGEKSDAGK